MNWERKYKEDRDDYGYRLYKNKPLYELTNIQIANILNESFSESKDESAHRKYYAPYIKGYDKGYERGLSENSIDNSMIKGLNSLAPTSHLDRFTELIGEYGVRKRDMQLERNELSKMYRTVTPWILMAEQYEKSLHEDYIKLPDFNFDKIKTDGGSIIKVLPADWHIGAKIEEPYNKYNYEVAVKRIDKYCVKILEDAKRENAKLISITAMGDFIEGFEMRSSQKWFCEFLINDQIKYAQELFMRMILTLSKDYNVEIGAVYGNHDRLVGDKNKSIGKDNAMKVIIENIKFAIKFAEEQNNKKMERITIVECSEDYRFQVETIYGSKCRWQHGHEDTKNDEYKIEKYNGVDNDSYNILGFGHLHHGRVIHKNRKNMEIYVGSTQGSNDYSKYVPKSVSNASQSIIIFRDNGDIIPYEVDLQ